MQASQHFHIRKLNLNCCCGSVWKSFLLNYMWSNSYAVEMLTSCQVATSLYFMCFFPVLLLCTNKSKKSTCLVEPQGLKLLKDEGIIRSTAECGAVKCEAKSSSGKTFYPTLAWLFICH